MSKKLIFKYLVGFSVLWAGGVSAEMRAFELPDGRTLEAEVIDYNMRLGKVTLKRADGKRVTVKPNIFIEKDQDYIREWSELLAFRSESVLKISCDDETVKDWKEEETKDIRYTDGIVEKDFVINVKKFKEIAFNVKMNNMDLSAIDGIKMEYCIYYEQSKIANDTKPEAVQKIYEGRMDVPAIGSKKKISLQTKSVKIYDDNLINIPQGGDGDVRRPGEGKVHGIRARFFVKSSSGELVMREVSSPTSLSEKKYRWKD